MKGFEVLAMMMEITNWKGLNDLEETLTQEGFHIRLHGSCGCLSATYPEDGGTVSQWDIHYRDKPRFHLTSVNYFGKA